MARKVITIIAETEEELIDKINDCLDTREHRNPHCVCILERKNNYFPPRAFIELDD